MLKYAFLLPVTGLLILAGNARAVTDLASHTLIQAGGETSLYKGRVVDEQGNPLQGATVIIKGTSLGASTDQDGEFSIQAGKGDTLYFSYVGKRTAEVICGDKANLKEVVLPKQPVELEGMVVVGYAKAGQNATSKEGEISHGCRGNAGIQRRKCAGLYGTDGQISCPGSGERNSG